MSHPEMEDKTVRFSSVKEEIEPGTSLQQVETRTGPQPRDDLTESTQQELRNLAMSLQKSRIQTKRMENFSFEPVSLPVSRVPSGSSQQTLNSGLPSPRPSPPVSAMHTPPLTPAASSSRERRPSTGHGKLPEPTVVTPQISPPHEPPPTSIPSTQGEAKPSAAAQARLPRSSNSRPKSMYEMASGVPTLPKQPPNQVVGPTGDSLPPSQEGSPSSTPRPGTPGTPAGAQSPSGRPFTPQADPNDPYSRAKRPPQGRNLDAVAPQFVFGSKGERPRSQYAPSSSSSTAPPPSNGSTTTRPENKRHTGLFGSGKHDQGHHQHSSMSDLKRFFKIGGHKKDKRDKSPARSSTTIRKAISKSGTRTPPSQRSSIAIPFADDHGLESKYGRLGKILGSGAGGSVRLMKRGSDGVTFAVKQFRDRHSYESEREYNKKVTAEFCIGSTLHHGNIIETMDIIHEKGKWYEVMEYAPYDLFAIVMTGKMSREEISCATLQILNGVTYLHSMGLAHRDLKLDNVVVNEHGIMKIIDFGSAVVFRYPFESGVVLASGIVGSDPYLAPEVYDLPKYDPRPTDVWSLAIIFCCMTLRRFPWKAPRLSDNSYKLFVAEPTEEEKRLSGYPQKPYSEPASRQTSEGNTENGGHHAHHRHNKSNDEGHAKSDPTSRQTQGDGATVSSSAASSTSTQPQQQVIKGPWRLLRLLPRETRHIVGRMLELDPKRRATLEEILEEPWVKKSRICAQEETGAIFRAEGHEHTLEPGAGVPTPAPSRK